MYAASGIFSSSSSVGSRLPLTTMGASLRPAERVSRYSWAAAMSLALAGRATGFGGVGLGKIIAVAPRSGAAGIDLPADFAARLPGGRPAGRPTGLEPVLVAGFAAGLTAVARVAGDFFAGLATVLPCLTALFGAGAFRADLTAFLAGAFAFAAIVDPSTADACLFVISPGRLPVP